MIVHVLQAEHFSVPGIVTKVFGTDAAAQIEAMALVNCMLNDSGRAQSANASNWHSKLEELQEEHGAAHCYVDIAPHTVEGAEALNTRDPMRDAAPDMLAALQWIGALIEGGEAMPKPTDDVAVAIFSAIAKAEGK